MAAGADTCLPIYWTFCQFSQPQPGGKLGTVPVEEGEVMNEFTAWIQSNWYELGNLLAEFVFLCVGIWFARKILRTLRASQEQVGALLKMSVTGVVPERQPGNPTAAERSFAAGSPYWLTPSETPAADPASPSDEGATHLANVGHGIVAWLNTPMKSGGAAPWRRIIKWLQSPARS
jgi:hypothetical protein